MGGMAMRIIAMFIPADLTRRGIDIGGLVLNRFQ